MHIPSIAHAGRLGHGQKGNVPNLPTSQHPHTSTLLVVYFLLPPTNAIVGWCHLNPAAMSSLTAIPGTPGSPAKEVNLGLQRLAEACPEFAHADLLEQLSEKRTSSTTKSSGLKLSWPKASNTRRAVVAKTSPTSNVPPNKRGAGSGFVPGNIHMINVTCGDIAVHYTYTGAVRRSMSTIPPVFLTTQRRGLTGKH